MSLPPPKRPPAAHTLVVAATFTAETIEPTLRFWAGKLAAAWDVKFARYGQVLQELLDPGSSMARNAGTNVILVRVADWEDDALRGAEEMVEALREFVSRNSSEVIVLVCPSTEHATQPSARAAENGRAQRYLSAQLARVPRVHAWTSERVREAFATDAYEDVDAYASMKVPYTPECMATLAMLIARTIARIYAPPLSAVVFECDTTLWSRGAAGTTNDWCTCSAVQLAGHELAIRAHAAGALVALCSAGDRGAALKTLRSVDMGMREDHVVDVYGDGNPISNAVERFLGDVSLTADQIVFVSADHASCSEVGQTLEELVVAHVPTADVDGNFYADFWPFDRVGLNAAASRGGCETPAIGPLSSSDWATIAQLTRRPGHVLDGLAHVGQSASSPPPNGGLREAERVRHIVRRELAKMVQIADPGTLPSNRGFFQLGLSSVHVVEFARRLGRALETHIPVSWVFTYSTVDRLATQVVGGGADSAPATKDVVVPAASNDGRDEPIAIVGMGCRFPGGSLGPQAYWKALERGVDAARPIPSDRWNAEAIYDPDPEAPGKTYARAASLLDESPELFDAAFFRISPREAARMDAKQRLLLEVAVEALEHAGIPMPALRDKRVGVFVGMELNEQLREGSLEWKELYDFTGSLTSMAAGRLSFFLGVQGPAMTVDTACSSSLVAVHLACQSLRMGEAEVALAGGANVPTGVGQIALAKTKALSPDGRCKAFSAAADGFGRGEGCGFVVLKRLSRARADGDHVLGIIRGSAINHDGASSGLTVPNGQSQETTIRAALANAGVAPDDVAYVECHGTGTPLGDPIEVAAVAEAYRRGRTARTPIMIGSVKTNIGHLEAAAGVAGLIKATLCGLHGKLPKSLHCEVPSPHIPWDQLPVRVVTEEVAWTSDAPLRIGVSSFGMSGTNAHVIVEQAPRPEAARAEASTRAEPIMISARTPAALGAATARLLTHVRSNPDVNIGDLAFTLATGRTHHEERLAFAVGSRDGLLAALEAASHGVATAAVFLGTARANEGPKAWLFTGQGAQVLGMGRAMHAQWPAFREEMDRVLAAIEPHLGRSLRTIMWAAAGSAEAALLDETQYTQPALFVMEAALAALWRSWGLSPDVLVGHSVGELVAAYVAGVWSLEDAARLVVARGRLLQALPRGGAMVAIAASEWEVSAAIAKHADRVALGAVNGPAAVVVSGAEEAVLGIANDFERRGVKVKRLTVSHAFHSPLVEPMLDEFARVARSVTYAAPRIPIVSNVTGRMAGHELSTPEYWVHHVRATVRFADAIASLSEIGTTTYFELGPKSQLLGLVPECLPVDKSPDATLIPSVRAERSEADSLLEAAARYYASGGALDWRAVFPPARKRLIALPTYPWQHQRHRLDRRPRRVEMQRGEEHPLLGVRTRMAGAKAAFETVLSVDDHPWLGEHIVAGEVLVPGAGLCEMARAAATAAFPGEAVDLTSIVVSAPLVLPASSSEEGRRVQVVVAQGDAGTGLTVFSQPAAAKPDDGWTTHFTAEIGRQTAAAPRRLDLKEIQARCREHVSVDLVYKNFDDAGIEYGKTFRGIQSLQRGNDEVLAFVSLAPADDERGRL